MGKFLLTAICITFLCLSETARAQGPDSTAEQQKIRTLLLQEVDVRPSKSISESNRDLRRKNLQEPTDKILEFTPGINMIRRGNFAMEPTIRSLSNGQISITIDGMRVFGACTDRMDPVSSYVEPNNLESISIVHNPAGNSWGSSIAGGLDFKLKQPSFSQQAKWSGLAGAGFETNGSGLQTLAEIEYSNADFAMQANGIFRRSGNYKAGGGKTVDFSQYRKWNGSVSAMVRSGSNAYLKGDYLQDEGYDIGYPALTMDVSFAKAKIAALSYVKASSTGTLRWETKVYFNSVDHAMDDTQRPPETVAMHMDMPGSSETFGAYSTAELHLNDRHHLKIGADAYHNKLSATMTMYPFSGAPMFMYTLADPVRNNAGFHLSDVITISGKLTITPALRVDYMYDYIKGTAAKEQLSGMFTGDLSRSRVLFNGGVTASYQANDHWSLAASLSQAGRAATLQEAYAFYIYNRLDAYDYIGNPELSQEKSLNLSLGSTYHIGAFQVEGNIYSYFMDSYIAGKILDGYSTMTIGARGVKQYVNIPSARIYGAEAALKYSPVKALTVSSINTFTRGSDNQDLALPLIAPFKTINDLSYSFGKVLVRMESVTNATQKRVGTAMYGETRTQGSTVLNFYAGGAFALSSARSLRVNAGVENLLDEVYVQHLDIMKIARPGRNFTFRMTMLF